MTMKLNQLQKQVIYFNVTLKGQKLVLKKERVRLSNWFLQFIY